MTLETYGAIASLLTTGFTFVTMSVVIWYTVETWRLRKQAERQNDTNILPVLLLKWPDVHDNAPTLPSLENIGNGPAFDVALTTEGIRAVSISFAALSVLPPRHEEATHMQISELLSRGQTHLSSRGYIPQIGTVADLIENGKIDADFEIVISYKNLAGRRYQTRFHISYAGPLQKHFSVRYIGLSEQSQGNW